MHCAVDAVTADDGPWYDDESFEQPDSHENHPANCQFAMRWSVCGHCKARLLPFEHRSANPPCCENGAFIIENAWPQFTADYRMLLSAFSNVLSGTMQQAGFINDVLAFATISVDAGTNSRAAFTFPYRDPQYGNLHLGGRTYCRLAAKYGMYVTVAADTNDDVSSRALATRALREYIAGHHAVARVLQQNAVALSARVNATLVYRHANGPGGGREQSIVGCTVNAWYEIPAVRYVLNETVFTAVPPRVLNPTGSFEYDEAIEPSRFHCCCRQASVVIADVDSGPRHRQKDTSLAHCANLRRRSYINDMCRTCA